MAKTLPPQPGLEYLKKQAKALLKAYKQSNPEVIPRIKEHHPRLSGAYEFSRAPACTGSVSDRIRTVSDRIRFCLRARLKEKRLCAYLSKN